MKTSWTRVVHSPLGQRAATVLLVCAATVLLVSAATVPATLNATVRGRLDRVDGYGRHYPAANVAVTLSPASGGKRYSPVYSDHQGMYYFAQVPKGAYNLEVWRSSNPNQKPIVFRINVQRDPTDVAPIVVP